MGSSTQCRSSENGNENITNRENLVTEKGTKWYLPRFVKYRNSRRSVSKSYKYGSSKSFGQSCNGVLTDLLKSRETAY